MNEAILPNRHIEAWHYTDLSQTDLTDYRLAASPVAIAASSVERRSAGQVAPLLSAADLPLVALNDDAAGDVLLIRVAAGTTPTEPIEILSDCRAEGVQFHHRIVLMVEENASATLIETHRGTGRYFSNSVLEIHLAAGAELHHVMLQDQGREATHIATTGIGLDAKARYRGVVLQWGGQLARHETHAWLKGNGADFALDGATLASGRQHLDNTTRVVHRAPHCDSRQLFKTVLDEQGHGVFQGTVLVERPAQKTKAYQMSRALMLSDSAAMDNKPELEIFADDVKCGHGATIGDIDENQLFYLRARGVDEAAARRMLTLAFLAEVIDRIEDEPARERLGALLQDRLNQVRP